SRVLHRTHQESADDEADSGGHENILARGAEESTELRLVLRQDLRRAAPVHQAEVGPPGQVEEDVDVLCSSRRAAEAKGGQTIVLMLPVDREQGAGLERESVLDGVASALIRDPGVGP